MTGDGVVTSRIDATAKIMMIVGFSMAMMLVLALVGTGLAMFWTAKPIPQELSSWANIALGFIFGVFPGLIKDWMART